MEAAEAAAKDAEKAKLAKNKSVARRGGRRGGRGGSRTRGSSSSSYSRRDGAAKRGETMRSERSRDKRERDCYRDSHRERDSYRRDIDFEMDKQRSRPSKSQGGKLCNASCKCCSITSGLYFQLLPEEQREVEHVWIERSWPLQMREHCTAWYTPEDSSSAQNRRTGRWHRGTRSGGLGRCLRLVNSHVLHIVLIIQ